MLPHIIDPSNNRLSLFPIVYNDIWEMRNKMRDSFWTADEINMTSDLADWNNLNKETKEFLGYTLAFFASADNVINENIVERFHQEVTIPEAKSFYSQQIANEDVHAETYAKLIDLYYSKDEKKKKLMFEAASKIPVVYDKIEWMKKWMHSKAPINQRLFAFCCVEGIFFSSPFSSIYWVCQNDKLKGLKTSNDFICRDESLHMEFSALLYSKYAGPHLKQSIAEDIIRECVAIEESFVRKSLPIHLTDMSADNMCQYVRYVADIIGNHLALKPIYNVSNPFKFMLKMPLIKKSNFFETDETNYQKANIYKDNHNYDILNDF